MTDVHEKEVAVAGIDVRTLQRWKDCDGLVNGDGRSRPSSIPQTKRLKLVV